jgi:hypothetical protein
VPTTTPRPRSSPPATHAPRPTPPAPPAAEPGDNDNPQPKPDKADKADRKDKSDKSEKGDHKDKSEKGDHKDKADHKDKKDKNDKSEKNDGEDHGSLPAPLAAGLAGWLAAMRRRLGRAMALVGAQIRGTARIRKKARGGMNGPPRVGSERPAGTNTCPRARSVAVLWRAHLGSCTPAASTRIRHPT